MTEAKSLISFMAASVPSSGIKHELSVFSCRESMRQLSLMSNLEPWAGGFAGSKVASEVTVVAETLRSIGPNKMLEGWVGPEACEDWG